MTGLLLRSVRALVFRAPVATPVTTSFGVMRDRPCVRDGTVSLTDAPGLGDPPDPAALAPYRVRH